MAPQHVKKDENKKVKKPQLSGRQIANLMRQPKPPSGFFLARFEQYLEKSKRQAEEIADNLTQQEVDGIFQGLSEGQGAEQQETNLGQTAHQQSERAQTVDWKAYMTGVTSMDLETFSQIST